MAKTLEFTTKSPRQIKQGDTETMFTFICKNAGAVVDLTQATDIIAKIGNYSGYLRSQPIAITSLTGLKPGWLNLQPASTLMAGLPAGSYQLEIWVIDQAGTSIYPSDTPLSFTITNNIENEGGDTITTITFDDFVQAMNKAASTIDKGDKGDAGKDFRIVKTFPSIAKMNGDGFSDGDFTMIASDVNDPDNGKLYVWNGTSFTYIADLSGSQGIKGDTGTVDNTGLISAPAFQSLQSQVDNSAVGTNLLINSSSSSANGQTTMQGAATNIWGGYSRTDSYEQVTNYNSSSSSSYSEIFYRFVAANNGKLYGLTPGGTYTLSGSASHTAGELKFRAQYSTGGSWIDLGSVSDLGIPVSDGSVFTPFSCTFTIPAGATGIYFSLQNYDYTAGSLFRFKNTKLEKGSKATNWCPNPTEILTQSDYAKIKAAIVALGGALS